MKKTILPGLLLISLASFSQNCSGFYYLQNNKVVEITITNKKGKDVGKNVYTISNVQKNGGTISSTVNSEFITSNSKSVAKSTNVIKCTGGIMMMDLKMFIPSTQQEQMGTVSSAGGEAYLEYPSNMKEGDVLKDGQFSMDYKTSTGMNGHMSVEITNRKVEGKESIITPAGTWDCFKITYRSKIGIKILVNIPMNSDVTEWYAPGFGVVKTESNSAKTEITSIK